MPMNSKIISQVEKTFKKEIENKEILDIIIFGSAIRGKAAPNDIDIAILTENNFDKKEEDFHISIKNKSKFSEIYNFKSKVMFMYDLSKFDNSLKVKIVNILRGKNKQKGFVEQNEGEWLSNGLFLANSEESYLFEKLLSNYKIPYKKNHILIH